ncbi:MAG: hypothetical protein OXC10_01895 [Rhodospirillaceae bacterium]|nr:hypothetical protein [Rhodospirillaceae bacterium]
MSNFQFTLIVDGPDLQDAPLIDLLFEVGCDDATVGSSDGVQYVDFDREAAAFNDAILSAVDDLEKLQGVHVVRIADAGLASLADIAARHGRTRESVRLLVSGARGPGGFPKPVTDPRSRYRLWRWSEVAHWFKEYRGELPAVADDETTAMYNAALEFRHGRRLLEPSDPVTLRELIAMHSSQAPTGAVPSSRERLQQSLTSTAGPDDEVASPTQPASPPNDDPSPHVSIEWTVMDMDSASTTGSIQGKEIRVLLKGRCTRCWGGLLARHDTTGRCTRIWCRVCGSKVEGEKAGDEYLEMRKQTALNLMNLEFGRATQYHNGEFVEKIFPQFETLSKKEFAKRIQRKLAGPKEGSKLTRHGFPPGSPGLLFIQARILLAGIAALSNPDEMSLTNIPDVRVMDDGLLAMPPSPEKFNDDPKHLDNRLWNRMGTTMIEAMTAAFACELAMKAISLTCTDEAPKTHDLIELHGSLPASSRQRIAADYPEITETLQAVRHTFGQWRYFEVNVGEVGMRQMFDVSHAHALGKAARVILDEGIMVGLSAIIDLNTTDNVHIVGNAVNHNLKSRINVKGREAAPLTDILSVR